MKQFYHSLDILATKINPPFEADRHNSPCPSLEIREGLNVHSREGFHAHDILSFGRREHFLFT